MSTTDWIQALCAFVTLVLAIVTMWQGRKIKTLTDVVSALKEQSEVAKELLDFEVKSRIRHAQPIFSRYSLIKNIGENRFKVMIRNRGLKAIGVHLVQIENVSDIKGDPKSGTVLTEEDVSVFFSILDIDREFKIMLEYQDELGTSYKQLISGDTKTYLVGKLID